MSLTVESILCIIKYFDINLTIMDVQKQNQSNDDENIQKRLDRIKINVKSYPDFPKSGIIFR